MKSQEQINNAVDSIRLQVYMSRPNADMLLAMEWQTLTNMIMHDALWFWENRVVSDVRNYIFFSCKESL